MEENKAKKMSYEELENVANQLSAQLKQAYASIERVNMTNVFKRLDYLFKVIENSECFNSDFVISCTEEIEQMLALPKSKENEGEDQ